MTFELMPLLEKIRAFYEQPADFNRFKEYLKILMGDSDGDLQVPIGAFNPMAKTHILGKLDELIQLDAEQIATETLEKINSEFKGQMNENHYQVLLNLADDLRGGWTNRYTSDYDNKFRINAIFQRRFCTPIFWTSENYSPEIIRERVAEYAYRTVYWVKKAKPITLKEHIEQEIFVAEKVKSKNLSANFDFHAAKAFFNTHQNSDNYNLIFCFLYGDEASESLGFAKFGVGNHMRGFEYAKRFGK